MNTKTLAILGAGSWGSAVAIHLARKGYRIMLWGHNPQHVHEMQSKHANLRYLPDVAFPPSIIPTNDLTACLNAASQIIIAVPSHAFVNLLSQFSLKPTALAWLTKGLDPITHALLSDVVAAKFGESLPIGVIAGPSFAREVAIGLPTALVIASHTKIYANTLKNLLSHNNMRVYLSEDIIGVQLCGAVKNVLAIACGVSDGLKYGANAKAALITRGLAEMSRLGLQLGAHADTFMGLAGVGDLVLTCTDDQSRNRRFGLQLGRGLSTSDAERHIGQVVEGMHNATQVCALALQHNVDMPICKEVMRLLQGRVNAPQAAMNLMMRPQR